MFRTNSPRFRRWVGTELGTLAMTKKNEKLEAERGTAFEDIVFHVERGEVLDIFHHPNSQTYAGHGTSSCSATATCTWYQDTGRESAPRVRLRAPEGSLVNLRVL